MRIHRHRRFQRQELIERQTFRANDRIRVPEVRVVDEEGSNMGVLTIEQALATAKERGFDLVEVNPSAQPPVCRFLDFKQFRYEQEKQRKAQKANAKRVEVKGVRLSLRIGEHDRQARMKQAKRFFDQGNKVSVDIILRGRERRFHAQVREVIMAFVEDMKKEYDITIDQPLSIQGGRNSLVIGGKRKEGGTGSPQEEEEEEMKESEPKLDNAPQTK
ncbi:MAG: translation initiation factor IF-3 [bacterium]|nr:translation initiation factor IF-3 [bacterium]